MKIWVIYLFLLIFLIISIILIYICVIQNKSYYIQKKVKTPTTLIREKKPKQYLSLTAISHPKLPESKKFLENQVPTRKSPYNYSTVTIPDRYKTSFDVRWKWPNCMPPAGDQGSCGSCWAFSTLICLSARFFTCPDPDKCVTQGDFEKALNQITEVYKIKKTTLKYLFNILDSNNDGKITKKEWLDNFKKYKETIIKVCVTKDCADWDNPDKGLVLGPNFNLGYIAEILSFMLNEPHISGNDSHRAILLDTVIPIIMECSDDEKCIPKGETKTLDEKALAVFNSWAINNKDYISLDDWTDYYYKRPLNLSVEEMVLCCEPQCEKLIPITKSNPKEYKNNPSCKGSSLQNAWYYLYTGGVSSSYCVNYNLKAFKDFPTPSCKEIQGPGYSYCAGSLPASNWAKTHVSHINQAANDSGFEPVTPNIGLLWDGSKIKPPVKHTARQGEAIMEWAAPNLFIFMANKPYSVEKQGSLSNEEVIMREIYLNGPVTTGMAIYEDFEFEFADVQGNKGGINWKKGDSIDKLIYNHKSGDITQLYGHAVIITGWGEYKDDKGKLHKYWIILNTWGLDWGHIGMPSQDNPTGPPDTSTSKSEKLCQDMKLPKNCAKGGGYFWMVRGKNTCGVEENVVVATADIDNIIYSNKDKDKSPIMSENTYGGYLFEENPLNGGGQWANAYLSQSMIPPSPYTLKWPGKSLRPIFNIGKLSKELTTDINIMIVDDKLNKILTSLLKYNTGKIEFTPSEQQSYQKNTYTKDGKKCVPTNTNGKITWPDKCYHIPLKTAPIIMIDDELIQVFNKNKENEYQILRGIWSHKPKSHKNKTDVYIFPYHQLYTKLLNDLSKGKPLPPNLTVKSPKKPTPNYTFLYVIIGIVSILFLFGLIMWFRRGYNPNRRLLKRN